MGSKPSTEKIENEVNEIHTLLENKLVSMEEKIQLTRGEDVKSKTEVQGGRTVMRVSEIRAAASTGIDEELSAAIDDFFDYIAGTQQGSRSRCAVDGAKHLLNVGLSCIFDVSSGQSVEKDSFVILFINNAFVRVDYYVYSYSASAKKWGQEKSKNGACYVADIAVIPLGDLKSCEIDYLVSQALTIPNGAFGELCEMKVRLVEVAVLSRMLDDQNMTFEKLTDVTKQLSVCNQCITDALAAMDSKADPPQPLTFSKRPTELEEEYHAPSRVLA